MTMLNTCQRRALTQAVHGLAGNAGSLIMHGEQTWGSATFNGTRHTMTFAFDGDADVAAGERMVAALPHHEFSIPGQLVADAAVTAVETRACPPSMVVDCSLLLMEEA